MFTVPVSAGQVDGSLGRWLMFIGAVGGLALIAAGLVLFVRARDAESRHREQISQVVAFQHELRWHMSEMASGVEAAADTNEDPAAVQARRVIADALDWFERELPEYFELLRPWLRSVHINELHSGYPYRELFGLLRRCGYDRVTLAEIPGTPDVASGERLLRYYKMLWAELAGA